MKNKIKADRAHDNSINNLQKQYAIVTNAVQQKRKYAKELQNLIGKKTTPQLLCNLIEEYIIKTDLLIKPFSKLPKKEYNELYSRIYIALLRLIRTLIHTGKSNGNFIDFCFDIALSLTNYLTNFVYKNPTPEFCKHVRPHLTMPFLISPWDSKTAIKNTFDSASERVGLAKTYKLKLKSRYSSIPTKIVLNSYTNLFLITSLPVITKSNWNDYWQDIKNDIIEYFSNDLSENYPSYYRSLRDERGDKTPVYIKRNLWIHACKQALKGIAKTNAK